MAGFGATSRATFLAVVKGDASQAVTEFRRMGGVIEKETVSAGGSVGRFQQLFGKAKSEISANAGLIAAGVGVAAVAVATKFAFMAQELALATGKLSDATGLSADAASRWIEVAGDIGIGTDEISGLLEKMTMNLGKAPDKFKQLGIEVVHAKDGTVDMNATLLSAIGVLSNIKDPTVRAALGAQLFGKSWATAAELIKQGAGQIRSDLAKVDSGKVMSDKDVQNARELRKAFDELKDKLEKVALSIGKSLLPVLTALADGLGYVADAIGEVSDALTWLGNDMEAAGQRIIGLWGGGIDLTSMLGDASTQALLFAHTLSDESTPAMVAYDDAGKEAAQTAYFAGVKAAELADHMKVMAGRVDDARVALTQLQDELKGNKSWDDLQLNLLGIDDKLADAKKAFDDGKISAEEYALTVASITDGAKSDIADYLTGLENVPASVVSQITTMFDPNNVEASIKAMQVLVDKFKLGIPLQVKGSSGYLPGTARNLMEGRASGGTASGLTLVGERGPELVNLPGGSFVHNAPETSRLIAQATSAGPTGSGGVVQYNTVNVGTLPGGEIEAGRRIQDALNALARSGG